MKGKFIVIEGIDGCGKTTQIDELSKWITLRLKSCKKNYKKNQAKSNMGFWLQLTSYTFSRRHFIP